MEVSIKKGREIMRQLCHAVENRLSVPDERSVEFIPNSVDRFEIG